VVVVNGAAHLWISPIFSTTSIVYVRRNPVGYRCVCLREKMDKNPDWAKNRRSPQSVPVDMQMLIHSPDELFSVRVYLNAFFANSKTVAPAKAGAQVSCAATPATLDPGLRRDDEHC
jgi:hypothetical protein